MLHFIISVSGWTNPCPGKLGAAQTVAPGADAVQSGVAVNAANDATGDPVAKPPAIDGVDLPVVVTFFPDIYATSKREETSTLRLLAELIRSVTATSKEKRTPPPR